MIYNRRENVNFTNLGQYSLENIKTSPILL